MSDIVIKADNLGKKYVIGHQADNHRYLVLRDVLMNNTKTLWNKTKDLIRGKPIIYGDILEEVWALKDISFDIHRGEAVGIIGSNGAGKSTLLKILSRIIEPTVGRVTIKGRIASLLEVGTGFHPELTGRENIFLNGTILGMAREEIKGKFDEIVAFAEIEKYLDTPVKRYSSGMYVRLAFAVAAHLEPEILVVDEVLAVGDAAFQRKCLGKMGNVAQQGRTVLFVSHNMNAIQRLCSQSIWIEKGKLIQIDCTEEVVNGYLRHSSGTNLSAQMELGNWSNRYGSGEARILSARILNSNRETTPIVYRAGFMGVEFVFENSLMKPLHFSMIVVSESGEKILHLSYHDTPGIDADSLIGKYRGCFSIPELPLCAGNYCIILGIHTQNLIPIDVVYDILPFSAEDMFNSPRPYKTLNKNGYCWVRNHFSISQLNTK